jgi:hypothetical protein
MYELFHRWWHGEFNHFLYATRKTKQVYEEEVSLNYLKEKFEG